MKRNANKREGTKTTRKTRKVRAPKIREVAPTVYYRKLTGSLASSHLVVPVAILAALKDVYGVARGAYFTCYLEGNRIIFQPTGQTTLAL